MGNWGSLQGTEHATLAACLLCAWTEGRTGRGFKSLHKLWSVLYARPHSSHSNYHLWYKSDLALETNITLWVLTSEGRNALLQTATSFKDMLIEWHSIVLCGHPNITGSNNLLPTGYSDLEFVSGTRLALRSCVHYGFCLHPRDHALSPIYLGIVS